MPKNRDEIYIQEGFFFCRAEKNWRGVTMVFYSYISHITAFN